MRGTRSAAFAVACAATALVAVAMLAVVPLASQRGGDAAASEVRVTSSGVTGEAAGSCATSAGSAAPDTDVSAVAARTEPTAPVESRADGAILGTSAADLAEFASAFNRLRSEACVDALPVANFRIDPCLEERLFWIAEDPSTDPGSAWRGRGAVRSDGVPETGCAGSLAGGEGDTAASVAEKWWMSPSHRLVLFRTGAVTAADSCVDFAMVHGGVPNETQDFVRAAARWRDC